MNLNLKAVAAFAAFAAMSTSAHAQFTIAWSTIDGGGGDTAGGTFALLGTIGQPDAAPTVTGGAFQITGGYWAGAAAAPPCYANCDNSTVSPVLNVADFSCFLLKYANADPYANCDQSTATPTLNVADFTCFLLKYAGGCP